MPFVCKLCNLEFDKEKKLWKHNISKSHIQKINEKTDMIIEIPQIVKINEKLTKDPELDHTDAQKLSNNGIGYGVNLNFKNGDRPIDCSFNQNSVTYANMNKNDNVNQTNDNNLTINKNLPTEKQKRIINYLVINQSKKEMTKTFFELLKKLDLPDYKLLTTYIISEDKINLLEKQKMLKVIELFKNSLLKKKESGDQVFNGMQIDDIVKLL